MNFSGTAVEAAGGNNFSNKGKFHGKKVEKHLRYEDLKGASKTKIDYAKKSCRTNGKNAANQINGLKNDRETFEIGVKEVLDEYYGEETLELQKQEEFDTFVQEIDDAALEIVEHYEEAAMERENAENLPYETEKVLVSFPYGTDWKTIETIVENEAVGYEVIDDGEYHIDETLPEEKKQQLAVLKEIKKDIVILAEVELGDTVTRAEEKFEKYDCVISADSNLYLESDSVEIVDQTGAKVKLNDPLLDKQWHLKKSNVPQAWARMARASKLYDVVVAVIDNGVDMEHPDLDDVLLKNKCVDVTMQDLKDQNNPYSTKVTKLENATIKKEAHNRGQYTGTHGTAVIGVLAAEAGNGKYGVGAASMGSGKYQNHIKVMAIKADAKKGSRHITIGYLAKAINYAVSNGADVISLSYSAISENVSSTQEKQITDVIQNAIKANIPVICAAGNDGKDPRDNEALNGRFPTKIEGVIGVGAVNIHNNVTDYSNQSRAVDILAHSSGAGYKIHTTAPRSGNTKEGYKESGGTSCATPQVAAAVAMMRCLNYSLTPGQILTRLQERSQKTIRSAWDSKWEMYVLDTGNSVRLTSATKK